MNRRGFLRFLGLAPVAAPFAVAAAVQVSASPAFIGIDLGAGDDLTAVWRVARRIDPEIRWPELAVWRRMQAGAFFRYEHIDGPTIERVTA